MNSSPSTEVSSGIAPTKVPATIRATVLTGHGGIDKLLYRDSYPTPAPVPGEVLVHVGACGIINTDINTRTGWYDSVVEAGVSEQLGLQGRTDGAASSWNRSSVAFPRIQGAAVVGHIASVGAGVDPSRIGERVIVGPSVRDESQPLRAQLVEYLGSERDGGFAEYVAVPARNAHPVESPLSDAQLATFSCSYDTAEEMLDRAALKDGETIVITGAAGGVGTALIQLSLIRGARVVAVAGASKDERLRSLGAHEFVGRDHVDVKSEVERLIGERGADLVADVVGGDIFDVLLKLAPRRPLHDGGRNRGPDDEDRPSRPHLQGPRDAWHYEPQCLDLRPARRADPEQPAEARSRRRFPAQGAARSAGEVPQAFACGEARHHPLRQEIVVRNARLSSAGRFLHLTGR